MKRLFFLLAALLPAAAAAAAGGGWQASSSGPGLQIRGQQMFSPALSAPEKSSGVITQISWRYRLNAPPPSGLIVHLCTQTRCVVLEGASGSTRGLTDVNAAENLHFVYSVQGKGKLPQTLRVLSNEVMVNYR
ncbi:flagellar protein FlhE [Erwinia tracheiphila]|uniref:Flagellar protein flhE n=1 Tax=Erwinia tracheiphila TaxID=65700 RepID=A0A0M2KEL9_9GAMM|nr:flagellar protein FlhE [Erwinia tracheiphila]EOS93193.1 flagellar protein [Erwinia tracheiphila PSU-1]KKF35777.1 flagellar protein flhE [Erwinia tracheiphila]UIA89960.1 flagellar protein FlhE [Erwinia tracheiphila]UIA98264.1 flagellar protein FlhE [Erwinia tracheiphila]